MKTEPLIASIAAARQVVSQKQTVGEKARVIYLSPQGKTLKQDSIIDLAKRESMVLLCGRYQGIDNRVLESEIDEEWSLGDFVISGGELAAMTLIDAMTRFQPGALGDEGSALEDSFSNGLLHSPEYTRPQSIDGSDVPKVLLSGDHEAIRKWRLKQSLGATWLKRPDLLQAMSLEIEQEELLEQFKQDYVRNKV
jgi:tRNA (guanine37-N1)-methyltransferase